jgi:hypothetical protein
MLFVGIFTEAANGKQSALLRTNLRIITDWDVQEKMAEHPGCRLPTQDEMDVIRHCLNNVEKASVNTFGQAFARAVEERGANGICLLTGHEGFSRSSAMQTCFVRSIDLTGR